MTSGITTMLVLAALLAPTTGVGQDVRRPPPYRPASGMVLDGAEWRIPTAEDALHAVTLGRGEGILGPSQDGDAPAVALLRQTLGPRPKAELDALANALADMIIANESEFDDFRAFSALRTAADPERGSGMPHAGSFDALIRVYETLATQVLAANDPDDVRNKALIEGHAGDPFVAARVKQNASRITLRLERTLNASLRSLFAADPEGRGGEYILTLIERSRVPEPCQQYGSPGREPCINPLFTAWCKAASLLHEDWQSEPSPTLAPDGLLAPPPPSYEPTLADYYGPDPERYGKYCFGSRSH